MAIEGNLEEMSLPTLMQSLIQESAQAKIQLQQGERIGALYLGEGQLHHAELAHSDPAAEVQTGEEVVYELLKWHTGTFLVEQGIPPPVHTIEQSWDFLLMEGLRQFDEDQKVEDKTLDEEEALSQMVANLSEQEATMMQELVAQQESESIMAAKSQQIQSILDSLVSDSTDITGAVVVDNDGLLLASVLNGSFDGNRVAAVSAGLISLAARSAQQLNQGDVTQTLIQAKGGNIIAMRAGSKASFVALTGTGVNLGMAFLECRDAAESVEGAL